MKAEIISIGTELLLGRTVNTNSRYLSQKLTELGIDVCYRTTVGDNTERLYLTLKRALHRSNIIITTGGLGPTVDDLTLEVIAQVLQKKLILNQNVLKDMKQHFQNRHIPMPKENLRQALIPEGAKPLKNESGTAPGLIISFHKKALIALPGVPTEMKSMIERNITPYLKKHFSSDGVILSRKIQTTGLAESLVNQKVKDILKSKPPLNVGIFAHTDGVDLVISACAQTEQKAERMLNVLEKQIRPRLKDNIYAMNGQTMEEVVGELLTKTKRTIATAESCTGGLLAKRITNISGSSKYFLLGTITYSNKQKYSLLDISKESLKKYGAVSKEVVREMAEKIKDLSGADIGLAITGIAGPTGSTKDKPTGLVYIAMAAARKTETQKFNFHGNRDAVRIRASQAALEMVRRYLIKCKR